MAAATKATDKPLVPNVTGLAEVTYDDYANDSVVYDYFGKASLDFRINDTVKFFLAGDIVENNKIRNWGTRAGIAVELR